MELRAYLSGCMVAMGVIKLPIAIATVHAELVDIDMHPIHMQVTVQVILICTCMLTKLRTQSLHACNQT